MRLSEAIRYIVLLGGLVALLNALIWIPLLGLSLKFTILAVVGIIPIFMVSGNQLRYIALGAAGAGTYGMLIVTIGLFGCHQGDLGCATTNLTQTRVVAAILFYVALLTLSGCLYVAKFRAKARK
jgi:hypothetical protein